MKSKKKKVKAPPYINIPFGCVQDYGVCVIISDDTRLITRWLNSWLSDKIKEEDFKGVNGLCFRYNGKWPVICLPYFPKKPRQIGTLAHEAFHAVFYVCDKIGMELSGTTEEMFSRMISYVVTEVIRNKERFKK